MRVSCHNKYKRIVSALRHYLPPDHPLAAASEDLGDAARLLGRMLGRGGHFEHGRYLDGYDPGLFESDQEALAMYESDPDELLRRVEHVFRTQRTYSREWFDTAVAAGTVPSELTARTAAIRLGEEITTEDVFSVPGPDGERVWDPARHRYHQLAARVPFKRTTRAAADAKPVVVFIIGAPASGKTFASQQIVQDVFAASGVGPEGWAVVNPDAFKPTIPEGNGGSASSTVVHEESAAMCKEAIKYGRATRSNMVVDKSGSDPDKLATDLRTFANDGYEVHLILVDTPPPTCARRNLVRGVGPEGRLFEPELLARDYFLPGPNGEDPLGPHGIPRARVSFEQLTDHPALASATALSGDDRPLG